MSNHNGDRMLRVGIIDDRSLSRTGLREMFQALTRDAPHGACTSVVFEGRAGQAATLIRATRPDLLVSGHTSGRSSLLLLETLARLTHPPAVLVIGERITDADARALLTHGAAGVLLHRSAAKNLTWALAAIVEGSRALSPNSPTRSSTAAPPRRTHPVRARNASPASALASSKSSPWSATDFPTAPSPRHSISARRRSRTTSAPCAPSSTQPAAFRPPASPGRRASSRPPPDIGARAISPVHAASTPGATHRRPRRVSGRSTHPRHAPARHRLRHLTQAPAMGCIRSVIVHPAPTSCSPTSAGTSRRAGGAAPWTR